jgi:hypothetical protein
MNMEIGKVSGSSSLKPLGSWIIAAALLALALPAGAFQTEWKPSPQTLKQLVDGGYEIKGFGVHSYGPRNVEGVFVLQKAGSVYQCYEFSILKDDLTTARQSLNCFELTAPYDRQPGKRERLVVRRFDKIGRAASIHEAIQWRIMMTSTHSKLTFAGIVAAFVFVSPAIADTLTFKADLKGGSQVPPVDSPGTGAAQVVADTAAKTLSWTITYSGLTGDPKAAHFHGPAGPAENAPPVITISDKIQSGSAELTGQQLADLEAGKWYINIHTAKFPDGEIRGQVEQVK